MTDQELIQLLHEKPPGDFTPFELDALRRRWTQSPELRQALVEHLHLETELSGALSSIVFCYTINEVRCCNAACHALRPASALCQIICQ